MKSLEIEISEKLYEHIQKLVDEESFESIDLFAKHAIYWLAELYGFGEQTDGKSLSELIADVVVSKIGTEGKEIQKVKTVVKDNKIPNKDLILETYGSSKFMFEDAIFAACQFAALKQGNPPISKEEFNKSLQQMEEAGMLTKMMQNDKIMWKRTE